MGQIENWAKRSNDKQTTLTKRMLGNSSKLEAKDSQNESSNFFTKLKFYLLLIYQKMFYVVKVIVTKLNTFMLYFLKHFL